MNIVVISASPNKDGLTAACTAAALEGIRAAGGKVQEIRLNELRVGPCVICASGWGTCQTDHVCATIDAFQPIHSRVCQADGLILITPVYWGDMSEAAKAFTDRLRRCEATLGAESHLAGKPVIAVAAAGGSGNGTITCLLSLERWIQHVRAATFDLISVNRWSRAYKLVTIRSAAQSMITGA